MNYYVLFSDDLTNYKTCSYDETNNIYMTSSEINVINFDQVKHKYVKPLLLSQEPKSVDAIHQYNTQIFFVEFKNRKITNKVIYDVRKKIYDSVLIFTDLTDKSISYLRKFAEFFLVYKEEKDMETEDGESCSNVEDKNSVPISSNYNYIAQTIHNYSHNEYIQFGLDDFQNYIFKKVHTYTSKEFNVFLNTLYNSANT